MASSFSTLGIELIATGEASGLWGDKTNVNLQMFQEITSGYVAKSIAGGAQTTALSITNATVGSDARQAVIELTGTITGNQIVTVPDSLEKVYIVKNATSGSHTVQFKTASGTGVTFAATEKTSKLVFADGTNIVDTGFALGVAADDISTGDAAVTIATSSGDITIDSPADIILDADGANVTFKDGGTSILDIANNSSDVELTVSVADKNFKIKGTDDSSAITALDIDMALAGKATFNGDVVVGGDLTVTGDDIVMGTNTSGNLLIADGTNFNSVAVGSLSEISTIANDDVFLAVDTSGGGLKKVARSTVVSGLATSGAISNVVEDTSPQLGGNLDTNSHNILIDDAHFIGDENGNEQIIFQTTSSAVNQFDVTNAATGNAPKLSATGGDSNIDLEIEAKGTGHVTVRGNSNSGAIQFNCEANTHGQILKAQPHSAGVTNEMLLPDGSNSTLVSLVATQTLTNKTLTTPVIAEIDSGSTITLDATTDIILDADGADIIFKDGGTSIATFTNSSTDFIIESATSDKDIIFKVNDGGSSTEVARFDGDVSAFLMASGKELRFADSGEKISGDGTDLTIASGAKINLTATSDVHIPNNVGIVFGGDSEKIEGDGTDMTISANNLTVDAAADIVLDAAGNNVTFKSGGTSILDISNSSSDAVITASVQDKDIIFKGDDGGSAVTALTMDMSAGGTSIFGAAAFNQEATLTDASTISWDVAASPVAKVTLGANRTLGAGSNAVAGQFVSLLVIQDGTGSRTLSFNAAYEFTADTAPTLTTTASKGDLFVFRYNGSKFLEVGRNLNLTLS
tara:strand:+ start:308 stop:2719 length:2412 start_codon:yes stop_codon:yes gene_type:complete